MNVGSAMTDDDGFTWSPQPLAGGYEGARPDGGPWIVGVKGCKRPHPPKAVRDAR